LTGYPLELGYDTAPFAQETEACIRALREKALLAARQETLARQKALEDYLVWREKEEDRRYREILGKELSHLELDAFKAGVAALREKDHVLMEAVDEARKAEEDAAKSRDKAAETLKQCRKDKEKIGEHRKIWQAGEARETERREDLEMEEFTGAKRPEMEGDSDD